MATKNPFDILGDDDNDDLSGLIEKQQKKIQAKKAATPPPAVAPAPAASATSKFPSKPSPPTQAAREGRNNNSTRGGSARGGYGSGGGRGGSGRPREFRSDNDNEFTDRAASGAREDGKDVNKSTEAPRQSNRGPRRQYQEGDSGRPQRRTYERHSGTGRGNELPRQGSGRGNWGSFTDEPAPQEHEETAKDEQKDNLTDKPTEALDAEPKDNKDEAANEAGEKEAEEDKEMTLEEYEKIREENRKALLAMKSEERKVEIDKDFQSMQLLSTKKNTDEVFIQLGSGKDNQKKKDAEKDERAKKSLPINEFLKPAEGERFYGGSGGRGRGNRGRGQFRGGYNGGGSRAQAAPAIEDQLEFPTLGGK